MKPAMLLPLVLLLAGCPTPPETASGQRGPNAKGAGGGPGNAGTPGGKGGPGAGGDGGKAGGPPGGEGKGGAKDGPGGDAAGGKGPPGGGPTGFMKFTMDVPPEGAAQETQAQVEAGEHVTVSGTAVCKDCEGALILRVNLREPVVGGEPPKEGEPMVLKGPLTSKPLAAAGAFSVVVPKGDAAVVVDLLVDVDNNGYPSKGDRMASSNNGKEDSTFIPQEDRADLELDASDRTWSAPSGGPGSGEGDQPPGPMKSGPGAKAGGGAGGGAPAGGPPPEGAPAGGTAPAGGAAPAGAPQ